MINSIPRKKHKFFIMILVFLSLTNLHTQITVPVVREIVHKGDTFIVKTNVLRTDNKTLHGLHHVTLRIRKIDKYKQYKHNTIYDKIENEDSTFYYFLVCKGKFKFGSKDSTWYENFGWHFYQEGNYENGMKTGHWKEFYKRDLCAAGDYQQDHKVGIWHYRKISVYVLSDTFLIYNYDLDSILYLDSRRERQYNAFAFAFDVDKKCGALIREPVFPYGGHNGLISIIGYVSTYGAPNSLVGHYNITLNYLISNKGICETKILSVKNTQNNIFSSNKQQEDDDECFLAHKIQQIIANLPKYWIIGKQETVNCDYKVFSKFHVRFD